MEQAHCTQALLHIERARVLTEGMSLPDAPPRLDLLELGRLEELGLAPAK